MNFVVVTSCSGHIPSKPLQGLRRGRWREWEKLPRARHILTCTIYHVQKQTWKATRTIQITSIDSGSFFFLKNIDYWAGGTRDFLNQQKYPNSHQRCHRCFQLSQLFCWDLVGDPRMHSAPTWCKHSNHIGFSMNSHKQVNPLLCRCALRVCTQKCKQKQRNHTNKETFEILP